MPENESLHVLVNDYARHLQKNFSSDIVKHNLINTTFFINSVHPTVTGMNDKMNLEFSFPFYGIYQDMKKTGKADSEAAEMAFWTGTRQSNKKKGDTFWYNKNLFSTLGYFIYQVLYGYGDEASNSVKKHFHTK